MMVVDDEESKYPYIGPICRSVFYKQLHIMGLRRNITQYNWLLTWFSNQHVNAYDVTIYGMDGYKFFTLCVCFKIV